MSFFSDLFEGNFSNLGTDVTHAPESLANNPTELEETLGGVAALATGGLALGGLGALGGAAAGLGDIGAGAAQFFGLDLLQHRARLDQHHFQVFQEFRRHAGGAQDVGHHFVVA